MALSYTLLFSIILLIFHYTIFCTTAVVCPDASRGECGFCRSQNDPHITTFDNVYYDNHQPLCYKYVTGCPNNANYIPFEIYACHYYCWGNSVACIGDVTVAFFDESNNAQFDINIAHTSTNAATDTLINSALVNGQSYMFGTMQNHQFGYAHTVSYTSTHRFDIYSGTNPSFYAHITYRSGSLEVFLSDYFENKICGLCGSFDGDQSNELLGSNGIQYLPTDITSISYSYNNRLYLSTSANGIINAFSSTYIYGPTSSPTSSPTPSPTSPTASPLTSAPTFTRAPTRDPTDITNNTRCSDIAQPSRRLVIDIEPLCNATGETAVWIANMECWECWEGWECEEYHDQYCSPGSDYWDACECMETTTPPEPVRRLQITTAESDCRILAEPCCDILWTEVISSIGWNNRIFNETTGYNDWIENCMRDVCLLTNNSYVLPCNTSDFVFSFARELAVSTSQDTYPILTAVSTPTNTDGTGDGVGDDDNDDSLDSNSGSDSSSDSDESMHIYAGKLVGNNDDDTDNIYKINILFSNSFLYIIIVTVVLFDIIVFWMCWVYKRNDNTTKGHIKNNSSDVDQSNMYRI